MAYNGRGYPQQYPLVVGGSSGSTSVKYADSSSLDAFGRLRVSTPTTIFDSKQIADNQPLTFDDAQVSGAGTSSLYNVGQASTTIATSNLTAGHRVRQTRRWFNYQPGKSQLIFETGVMGAATDGNTKRIGLFNDDDGIYWGQSSAGLFVGIRSSTSGAPVDNDVPQASWNVDRMDGSGPSRIAIDPTKTQILMIDFEWLGVGRVRIGFVVNGMAYVCHEFLHANVLSAVYMATPNLPIRYEILNDGTGPAASLTQICSTVITEGGRADTGITFGINRDTNSLTVANANMYSAIGIRLKTTHLGAAIRVLGFSLVCVSTAEYSWYLVLNPTLAGAAFAWSGLTNSSIEYSFGTAGTTLTGGTILATGVGSDTSQSRGGALGAIGGDIALGSSIAGAPDELYLAIRRLTGGNETFYASINIQDTN